VKQGAYTRNCNVKHVIYGNVGFWKRLVFLSVLWLYQHIMGHRRDHIFTITVVKDKNKEE